MPKKLNVDLDRLEKRINDDLDRLEKDKEAERQQRAKEAERQRALDAETIPLKIINGPDGELDANARLSGTLQEFIEKEVAPELGVLKECAKHLEAHLSGYQLKPNTKIIRDFTELCSESEIEVHGIEKAMEAMQIMEQQQAAELNVYYAAETGSHAQLNLV